MIEIVKCLQPTVQMRGSVAEPLQGKKGKAILVVGSMNMDVTIEGKKFRLQVKLKMPEKYRFIPEEKERTKPLELEN